MTKTRVIAVDDNPTNLRLVGDLLEYDGFEVIRCTDGESCLKAVDDHPPDMILMDVALPDIDGLTLTRTLKADRKTAHIKIIAITAFAMKLDREKALAAGCDGYITKPIDTRKFTSLIREYLTR